LNGDYVNEQLNGLLLQLAHAKGKGHKQEKNFIEFPSGGFISTDKLSMSDTKSLIREL